MTFPAPTRSGSWTLRFAPVLILTALWALYSALISPVPDVPQNDDWAYALSVQGWLETGRLETMGWNDPSLLGQLIWGGLFVRVFGGGLGTLQVSTLILAWIGTLALYGALRRVGLGRGAALLAAAVFVLNPIHLLLAASFNTDAPYLALVNLTLLAVVWARERPSLGRLLLVGLAAGSAYLIRQQALFLTGAALVWLLAPRDRGHAGTAAAEGDSARPDRRRFGQRVAFLLAGAGAIVVPVAAAVIVQVQWREASLGPGGAFRFSNLHPFFRGESGPLDLLSHAIRSAGANLLDLAPFLLAILVAVLAAGGRSDEQEPANGDATAHHGPLGRSRGMRAAVILGVVAIVLLSLLSWEMARHDPPPGRGWPYLDNYLTRRGALPPPGASRFPVPRGVWHVLTWIAPVAAAGAVAGAGGFAFRHRRGRVSGPVAFLLLAGIAQWAPALVLQTVYARYALVLLPGLAAALLAWRPPGRVALSIGAVFLVLSGLVSMEYARASIDRTRAFWRAAEGLLDEGARPEEIQGDVAWEGTHLFLTAVDSLGARPPFNLERSYPWTPLLKTKYSFREIPSDEESRPERTYRVFLGGGRREVVPLTRPPRAAPVPGRPDR